jgi:hypothetical protein
MDTGFAGSDTWFVVKCFDKTKAKGIKVLAMVSCAIGVKFKIVQVFDL